MKEAVGAVLAIIGGLLCVIFSRSLARYTSDFNYRLTRVQYQYGETLYQVFYVVTGIVLLVYGVLSAVRIPTPSS